MTTEFTQADLPEYIHVPTSKSAGESAVRRSFGRFTDVARNSVQSYIASFLDSNGKNRRLFRVAGMDFTVSYVTNMQYDPGTVGDPGKKHIQLARMFSQLVQKIPAIIIMDTSVNPLPSSIGDWDHGGMNAQGVIELGLLFRAELSLEVICVTYDENMTNKLRDVMLSIFGTPLRRLAGGFQLESSVPGSSSCFTLNVQPPSMPEIATSPVNDDGIQKHAYFSFPVSGIVENTKLVGYTYPAAVEVSQTTYGEVINEDDDGSFIVEDVGDSLDDYYAMSFSMLSSTVNVGVPTNIFITNEEVDIDIFVNNPEFATVSGNMLYPKKRGSFTLYARRRDNNTIVASKTLTVA